MYIDLNILIYFFTHGHIHKTQFLYVAVEGWVEGIGGGERGEEGGGGDIQREKVKRGRKEDNGIVIKFNDFVRVFCLKNVVRSL